MGTNQPMRDRIFAVAVVSAGIPTDVLLFKSKKSAKTKERKLRKLINPERDEIGIFCTTLKN
jgi:hypothetical protein